MKFCIHCGAPLKESSKYCTSCGSAVAPQQTAPEVREEPVKPELVQQPVKETPKPEPKPAPRAEPKPRPAPAPKSPPKPKVKKPLSKKAKALLILAAVLVVMAVVGVFVLRWYFSPEQRSLRAIERGDYEEALEILEEEGDGSHSDQLIASLEERITGIQTDFTGGTMDYAAAQMALDGISSLGVQEVADKVEQTRVYIAQLNQSRTDFATAESFFEREDYPEAIESYRKVLESDANYETAKQKAAEAVELYRQKVLEAAEGYAAAEAYGDAIAALKAALSVIPDDSKITQQIALYEKDLANLEKSAALAAAEGYAGRGDYLSAMTVLSGILESQSGDQDLNVAYNNYYEAYVDSLLADAEAAQQESGYVAALSFLDNLDPLVAGDKELTALYESYETAYVNEIIAQADALVAKKDYDGALAAVRSALKNIPGNSDLSAKITAIENAKPKYLMDVCPPYETRNYTALVNGESRKLAGESRTNGFKLYYYDGYAIFNLNGQYSGMEFDVGHEDGSGSGDATIQIFLDGVLYKSIELDDQALPQHITISLDGAKQMKIQLDCDDYDPDYDLVDILIW